MYLLRSQYADVHFAKKKDDGKDDDPLAIVIEEDEEPAQPRDHDEDDDEGNECSECDGHGEVDGETCEHCGGTGVEPPDDDDDEDEDADKKEKKAMTQKQKEQTITRLLQAKMRRGLTAEEAIREIEAIAPNMVRDFLFETALPGSTRNR